MNSCVSNPLITHNLNIPGLPVWRLQNHSLEQVPVLMLCDEIEKQYLKYYFLYY